MTGLDWKSKATAHRERSHRGIRPEWRLSDSILNSLNDDSDQSVMHIPSTCGILSASEIKITESYDATELVNLMAAGKLSSYNVTMAFCKRAAICNQLVRCCTEMFIDKALERAKYCDAFLASNGRTIGPLHGLPISLKDSFNIKGEYSTIGYVSYIDDGPANENSTLVDLLLDAGAVLYVKTNVPTTLMCVDTINNIFGRTLNPERLSMSAGGSSGGEGALIKMRGSPLGVGTDIGGSIRIPANCNGIYGYRPSARRIPYGRKKLPDKAGNPGVLSVAGPLSRSSRDLMLFAKTVGESKPYNYDHGVIPAPWIGLSTASEEFEKLIIGVIEEADPEPVHPPVATAIQTAVNKLKAGGHTIKYIRNIPNINDISNLAYQLMNLDCSGYVENEIRKTGEPPLYAYVSLALPAFADAKKNYAELFENNVKKEKLQDYFNSIFVKNQLDIILAPSAATTTMPHDTYGIPHYTVIWNLMDYPAVVVPIGKASKAADGNHAAHNIANRLYDPEKIEDMPTTIQLVGRHFQDERLLHNVQIISQLIGKEI